MYTLIDYTLDNELALIGLARAPVNALGLTLRQELQAAFRQASADPAVKAMVVYGRGLPFCAGADIAEFGGADFTATPGLPELLIELAGSAKPMIAAVGGLALGGGLELAMACGYRIGEPKARLGMPEITLGLLPGAGGTQRLTRLVGAGLAKRLILGAETLDGAQAQQLGLVQWATPRAQLAADAAALAERVAAMPRAALAENKRCIALAAEPGEAGFAAEIDGTRRLYQNPESQRLVAAFLDRQPR